MRILQLRFLNLNALTGEWEIDFTGPDYSAEGIFAITGPTGAGKTTLLDAICLALYGRTPRLSRINRATNEIMSRQTGECFAEVTYLTQRGHYRSHWGQHRARRRPDGELQAARHEIMDMASGKVLETGVQEVAKKTEAVTGMDFHRFTRSMLLAQGDFAAFLNASPDERAPILEQITGTEIYSRISMHVHQRRADEQQRLAELQTAFEALPLLDCAALEQLQHSRALGRQQLALLEQHVARLERHQLWLQQLADSEEALARLQADVLQQEHEWNQAAPQREHHARAVRAASLDPSYLQLATLRTQQQDDEKRLALILAHQQQSQTRQKQVDQALQQAQQRLAQAQEARRQAEPVIRQARKLDQQVFQATQDLQHALDRVEEQAEALSYQMAEQHATQAAAKECAQQRQQVQRYLEQHARDADLEQVLAGIAPQLESWRANQKDLDVARQRLAEAEAALHQARQAYAEAQQREQRDEDNRARAHRTLQTHEQALTTLLAGRLLRELHAEKDALRREQMLQQKILDLQAERAHLRQGHPCPLCGAVDHPFVAHEPAVSDEIDIRIQELDNRIEQADSHQDALEAAQATLARLTQQWSISQRETQAAQHAVAQAEAACSHQRANVQQLAQKGEQLQQQVASQLAPFRGALSREDGMPDLKALQTRVQQWQHHKNEDSQLGWKQTGLNEACQRLTRQIEQAQERLQQARQTHDAHKNTLNTLRKARAQCLADTDVDAAISRWEHALETARQEAAQAVQAQSQHKQEQAAQQAQAEGLQQALTRRAVDIASLEQTFLSKLQIHGFIDEADFRSQRLDADALTRLQQHLAALDTQRTRLAARQQEAQQRHNALRRQSAFRPAQTTLATALESRRQALSALREEVGALNHRLRQHEQTAQQAQLQQQRLEQQQQVVDGWEALHLLIGSADGKKFRNFAQGLTFEWMVAHANRQLQAMTDRYVLVHDASRPLELDVIDNYQAGERRSTKNLSGGESFIVSLSLALGLSRMASDRIRVDSLFLDEGFGTLDEDALDVALDTLANLQHEGRLIGVISHVPALKDRIRTQIRVMPVSGGRSRLEGPGCRQPDSA